MKIKLYNWQNRKTRVISLDEALQLPFFEFVECTIDMLNEAENTVVYSVFSIENEEHSYFLYQNSIADEPISLFNELKDALQTFIEHVKQNPNIFWYLTQSNSDFIESTILIYPKGALLS